MTAPVIQVEDVSRWYGDVVGLSSATLAIGPGVTGLLGPNGAGKSTLVRILSAQIRPSRGEARILGQRVWGNPELQRRVGYCPESDALYEGFSAADFLVAMLALSGVRGREARRRAADTLALVGLDPESRKPMGAFSKGMRQRAKLGQALLLDPEVLILDEPLNGMDPVGRRETMQRIAGLGAAGRTVLVSSHILHEVEAMTRQVVLLHRGRVLAHGEVHEIRDLIEERAHVVRLRCRDPHRLAAKLIDLPDVAGVRFTTDPHGLQVETSSAESFFERLTRLGADPDLGIDEVLPLDDDLQSVFEYLVH
jgi:ABC-2 type transport system ATP-binding protein